MEIFLIGFALVFVYEGIAYALFPDGIKNMMALMQQMSNENLRIMGISAAVFGVILVWIIKHFFI